MLKHYEREKLIWEGWQIPMHERERLIWGLDVSEGVKEALSQLNQYAGGCGIFSKKIADGMGIAIISWLECVSSAEYRIRFDLMGYVEPEHKPRPSNNRAYLKHKAVVFERDGFKCVYCGSSEGLRIPQSKGGSHDPENLAACCLNCNSRKGARTPQEWMEALS